MKNKLIFIIVLSLSFMVPQVLAGVIINNPSEFQALNPDIGKYLFTKLYITGLEYFQFNDQRIEKKIAFSEKTLKNTQRVRALLDSLVMDNVNLRIAKNYMKRFRFHPENALMRQVSKLFLESCDEQIEFNNLERILLEKLVEICSIAEIEVFNWEDYNSAHDALSAQRRESLKKVLETSMLVAKVLISNKSDESGVFSRLGVTEIERDKLLFKLDEFYGKGFEGSIRPGLTFLEASIVTLREVLEDSSLDTIK